MKDYSQFKPGNIVRIKGIFGIDCIGIFNKFENDFLYLYCASYMDMHDAIMFPNDKNYCTMSNGAINTCVLATEEEIKILYDKIIIFYLKYVDSDWYHYLTDSTYYEVQDWFAYKCNLGECEDGYPEFIYEFSNHAWKYMLEKIGCEDEDEEEITINKKDFIKKAKLWLMSIDYDLQYQTEEDGFDIFDKIKFINDFCKAMEE